MPAAFSPRLHIVDEAESPQARARGNNRIKGGRCGHENDLLEGICTLFRFRKGPAKAPEDMRRGCEGKEGAPPPHQLAPALVDHLPRTLFIYYNDKTFYCKLMGTKIQYNTKRAQSNCWF